MKRKILIFALMTLWCVGTAFAQLGGIVYDPTNYSNAVLRYAQLEQHLVELRNSYAELVTQYNLALQMSRSLANMPARYGAQFSSWRNTSAPDAYGNTSTWVYGVNSGLLPSVRAGYEQATTELLPYRQSQLSQMNGDELSRVRSQYATVELADGANTTAIGTIGAIRGDVPGIETQINHLEQDSLSSAPSLNTEVAVLNKINAAGVLILQTLQDSNKLLASLLEEQTILAKQQREITANTINADIERQASLALNLAPVTGTLTNSLQNFRMP